MGVVMRNLGLIGAAFTAFATFNLALPSNASAAGGCGTAEVVKGKVTVKRGTSPAAPLAQGEQVCAGDQVTTAAESRVKLSMDDGNVLNVNPGSAMKIERYENDAASAKKKVLLNVMYGKMRATVNQKYDGASASGEPQTFQVKTKSAVAGVRGTDFLTSFSPRINKMEVVTFEGKVEVGQVGPGGAIMNAVSVTAGQKTEASIGQPPAPPKPVPPAELQKIDGGSQAGPAGERPQTSTTADNGAKANDKENQDKKAPGDKRSDGDKRAGNDGGSKGGNSSGGSARAPANQPPPGGGGTMMPVDADTMTGGPMTSPTLVPPPLFTAPTMPIFTPPPTCEFCNQAIQTGPARVNVKICLPGQSC